MKGQDDLSRYLDALLDRIIPPDESPGAIEVGVGAFVRDLLARGLSPARYAILAGLGRLEALALQREGQTFVTLTPEAQDRLLACLAPEPWFATLCELAAEGYYADPGQGANLGAVSWQMIGYRHGLPDGPEGPPWNSRDAETGKLWA